MAPPATNRAAERPFAGFGLGLRPDHFRTIVDTRPAVDWFEIISENFMVAGGKPLYYLDRIREEYPIAMHGVSLSIGGSDPLDAGYLGALKALADRVEPLWISDHLCWTGHGGQHLHDLYPLPYTEEAIAHVVERVQRVQDTLGQRILLENVSSYLSYRVDAMPEWEFLRAVVERADCLVLLDINNIHVSAINHGFAPGDYLDGIPPKRVWQIHLAGHTDYGDYVIDTHDQPVPAPVWDLYESTIQRLGPVSTMIERDDNIPPLDSLLEELDTARTIAARALETANGDT
ncbi:MAG: DUF692 domain-containing protein [Alphaproteobacteria bacterium]|nr:MAG: DUF692 domain-containing protein [Alphaproteobacteria bacterium]